MCEKYYTLSIDYVVDTGEGIFKQDIVELAMSFLDWVFQSGDHDLNDIIKKYSLLSKHKYSVPADKIMKKRIMDIKESLDVIKAKDKKDYLPDLGLQGIYHSVLQAMGLDSTQLKDADHYYLATLSQAISDYEAVWQRLRHSEYKYFRGFIMAWGRHNYSVTESNVGKLNAVKVMTIHKSKGLEFPVLFIPYLNKKKKGSGIRTFLDHDLFDHNRYAGDIEDDRRVYYVAMTRSKKYLFLSGMTDDPSVKLPREPAEFVNELDKKFLSKPVKLHLKKSGLNTRAASSYDFNTTFSDLLVYGRCGYDYKLRYVLGYNAGVPVAFGYGTQVHNILNLIHAKYRDKKLSRQDIEDLLNRNFFLRYAPGNIIEDMKKAAVRLVSNYIENHGNDFNNILETEKKFEFSLDNTLITGQIDLIKKIDTAGKLLEVEVVDFKSDKNLPQNDEYKHQLRLYVLACIKALNMNPQRATIHDLDSGNRLSVDISEENMRNTVDVLRMRIEGINKRVFQPKQDKKVCSDCDYDRICCHCIKK